MVDIKIIRRSYLVIIKVLLTVNIEMTQYLRLQKFDKCIIFSLDHTLYCFPP